MLFKKPTIKAIFNPIWKNHIQPNEENTMEEKDNQKKLAVHKKFLEYSFSIIKLSNKSRF